MSGWKTYLCVALAVIVLGLKSAGSAGVIPILSSVPAEVWDFILYLLGFGGLASLRAAVGRLASAVAPLPRPDEPELPSGH